MIHDTTYSNSYYPAAVAAAMAGYSARQVRRLAQHGKVRAKRQGRRLAVHLGSLYQYRSRACAPRRAATCLDGWLVGQPDWMRVEPYPKIANRAEIAFRRPVSSYQIRRSFQRLGWLPKPIKGRTA